MATQRNKRSLDAMLKVIAPYVCPRQIVEWRTAGQWRASPQRSKRLDATRRAISPCIDDDDVLIDDVVIPFAPKSTVLVKAKMRYVGPLEPDDAPIEVYDDAPDTE